MDITRRHFFSRSSTGIGIAALGSLLAQDGFAAAETSPTGGLPGLPHFAPKAKRVVFLHQSGGPSQMDLFDYKPTLDKLSGTELPGSVRMGQRITGMTSGQSAFPVARSIFKFERHGQSGAWVSELLPHTAKIVDELAIIKTMNTDAINHDPAITFIQSGSQQPGRPSMGAWVSYGLGSTNRNLPAFVVMLSQAQALNPDQPLFSRLWGSGFLPSNHQGVRFRAGSNPVLYLHNPEGIDPGTRREMLDAAGKLNRMHLDQFGDPEIETRISQYEMAFRMQTSVPDLLDLSKEPQSTFDLYGPDARKPGTYAANCLLARRLLERDVRFVQLYHRGWDQHNDLPRDLALQCKGTDQASAALVTDLKQRGLLDDTLVVWGGEFGRTPFNEKGLGRDHNPWGFTIWMAGGGAKKGHYVGSTDEIGMHAQESPAHVNDIHASMLWALGLDHLQVTYMHNGRAERPTVVAGEVIKNLFA
jgi:hypothetical protein